MKVESKYQTIRQRIGAEIVDLFLFSPLFVVYYLAIFRGQFSIPFRIFIAFLWPASLFTYQIAMHVRYGQTVGKMIVKIRLVDISGSKLKAGQAFLRPVVDIVLAISSFLINLPALLDGQIPSRMDRGSPEVIYQATTMAWAVIAVIILLANSKRRSIPDFIAGSVIVKTNVQSTEPDTVRLGNPPSIDLGGYISPQTISRPGLEESMRERTTGTDKLCSCPVCNEPFEPTDYRPDAIEPKCSSCHSVIDLGAHMKEK